MSKHYYLNDGSFINVNDRGEVFGSDGAYKGKINDNNEFISNSGSLDYYIDDNKIIKNGGSPIGYINGNRIDTYGNQNNSSAKSTINISSSGGNDIDLKESIKFLYKIFVVPINLIMFLVLPIFIVAFILWNVFDVNLFELILKGINECLVKLNLFFEDRNLSYRDLGVIFEFFVFPIIVLTVIVISIIKKIKRKRKQ